jgi:energy-coupling factor transporter ATP-binding protein EcfA2
MIARALMHQPKVLFLDEPTTGLDPAARLFVWDRLRELRERGVTLVLTTHDMNEATKLADRVGIMDHGKLLAMGCACWCCPWLSRAFSRRVCGASDAGRSTDPDSTAVPPSEA